jgi:hypothetical protein
MKYRTSIGMLAIVVVASPALAQPEEPTVYRKLAAELHAQVMATPGVRMAVESKVTTGRPYSAEATTEFVQVLADGNRIAKKTSVRIYRDGDGRTRREELGAGDAIEAISIYDPVGHLSFMLNPKNRTAIKSAMRIVYPSSDRVMTTRSPEGTTFTVTARGRGSAPEATQMEEATKRAIETTRAGELVAVPSAARARMPLKSSTESLGQQTFDGVAAEGTRTTTVIPAGEIGNQQEIRIVSEQWFSSELQVLVMTRHSDPRSGETTYRLTNIIRADPGPALFEVPADYTVREAPMGFSIKREPALQY